MLQPSDTLTDCVNGTLITYNGNENMLQNDMGNYALKGAKLPVNYVPIGMKEYAGVLYVVAYNPVDKRVQLGSYPSPKVSAGSGKESPHASVEVTSYTIPTIVTDNFNPMELIRRSSSDDKKYLHSEIVKNANSLMQIIGSSENSSYYLTINDQFTLHIDPNMSNGDDYD
jgi:hypothetical protein